MQQLAPPRSRRSARLGLTALLLATSATVAGAASFVTSAPSQLQGLDGWTATPLFTIGESIGGYQPVGILDGLGAQKLGKDVVRVYASHELTSSSGVAYSLANGLQLKGARISTFDIDRATRTVCGAGLAYDTVYDRLGTVVTQASQINETGHVSNGFDRFCSAAFYDKGAYGFADDVFFANEETGNGSIWALDTKNRTIWACPALGRGAWENVCALDTGCKDRIALLLGDDEAAAPLYLWIGRKDRDGGFLARNGLSDGQLYVWAAANGDLTPEDFNGIGAARSGAFIAIDARDVGNAGNPGYDAQGYLNATTLRAQADALGAFSFSRPEDLHANPRCGTQAIFASTGRGSLYPSDNWGTIYLIDVCFPRCRRGLPGSVAASLEIVTNADDLLVPDAGIRSPDNLCWAEDGFVYVQEDKSTTPGSLFGAVTGIEASIFRLDPWSGEFTRIAVIDRSGVGPAGVTDPAPNDLGNWETSGIIDVTKLFPRAKGERLLLCDVQAHSLTNGPIGGNANLVQGGQLLLLSKKSNAKVKSPGKGDDERCERDDD
jgi:hypothetical protein